MGQQYGNILYTVYFYAVNNRNFILDVIIQPSKLGRIKKRSH